MSSFLNGLQIKFLFCCFFMQTFPGPKCLKISIIAKLSVCLWFSSFFQVVGARANLGASSGASHFDAGPTVHFITILALRWLWRRVTLRSNWAINLFTSVLRQWSGLTQSLPVWEVLIWTWGIAVMSSWFRFRQRLLCGRIWNGHTCKVLVLVWLADAGGLPQSFGPFIFVLKEKWRARLSQQPTSNPKLINIHVPLIPSINVIELQNNDAMLKVFFLYVIPTNSSMKCI